MTNTSPPTDPWDSGSRPSGAVPGSSAADRPVRPPAEPVTVPPAPNYPAATSQTTTTDTAKQEAANVKDTAVSAGSDVAQTAKEQAGNVVAEAKSQATDLLHQVRGEVSDQAGSQLSRVADALHSLSNELGEMASKSEQSGPATDLVQRASRKGGELAHWLADREPTDVLEEVKSYARRRPVTFLGICFAAGLVGGRLTRGAVAANTSLDSPSSDQTPQLDRGVYGRPDYVPAAPPVAIVESAGYSESASGFPGPAAAAGVDPLARTTNLPPTDPSFR